jgi:hypothetical protein
MGVSVLGWGLTYPIVPTFASPTIISNPLLRGANAGTAVFRIAEVLSAFRAARDELNDAIDAMNEEGGDILRKVLKIK